jgi:pyruvate/2-oxoglutarate dehydrogenase complex dihydrolipoamide dehydrogenase (E3) component
MIAIGGGAAGLVTALGSAGTGAKCAIIERHLMGGDCLNTGCVPSKAFIKAATVAYHARKGEEFGVEINGTVHINFGKAMERMRKIRAKISVNDSVHKCAK